MEVEVEVEVEVQVEVEVEEAHVPFRIQVPLLAKSICYPSP